MMIFPTNTLWFPGFSSDLSPPKFLEPGEKQDLTGRVALITGVPWQKLQNGGTVGSSWVVTNQLVKHGETYRILWLLLVYNIYLLVN